MVRRTSAIVATGVACFLALAGAAAQAQQLGHRPDRPRCNNPRAIARAVQLTPEQVQFKGTVTLMEVAVPSGRG